MRMSTASGGGGGGRGGGGRGGGGRYDRGGGGGGSGLPREILARLSRRRKNVKVVSLDFKVPNMPSLPSEDDLWKWLEDLNLTDDEVHEIDYCEREIIEKKVYVCMKEESGADWLAEKFEGGLKFKVSEEQEVTINGRKEGERWLEVVVRGVFPNTEIKAVEEVFKQFGDVKEVAFVTMGPRKVKFNRLTLKVKLVEGKSLPGFVLAPLGEGEVERWEVTSKGPGGSKVCLHCYQHGHIRKQCQNRPPTMADVVGGRAGAAISYAQALAGTKAAPPVVPAPQPAQQPAAPQPVPKPSPQPSPENNANTRRTASQDSARQKNGAVSSGQPSGESVTNLLISPVAATNQALELQTTVAKAHTTARVSKASSMENLNPTHNATGGSTMPVGTVTGKTVSNPLISPVAATTQAHEASVVAKNVEQAPVKQPAPSSDDALEKFKSGALGPEAVQREIEKLQSECDKSVLKEMEEEKKSNQEQLKRVKGKMVEVLGKESLEKDRAESRDGKRKNRDQDSGGERSRSSSEKRKREDKRRSSEKRREDNDRKSRESHPPHKGAQPWKSRTDSENKISRKNGSHK